MGGQTGLNIAKELSESGILDKYGVELLGAKLPSIDRAEDRDLFKQVPAQDPRVNSSPTLTHVPRHNFSVIPPTLPNAASPVCRR